MLFCYCRLSRLFQVKIVHTCSQNPLGSKTCDTASVASLSFAYQVTESNRSTPEDMTPQVRSHFQDPGRVRNWFDMLWQVGISMQILVESQSFSGRLSACSPDRNFILQIQLQEIRDRKPGWFMLGEEKSNQWSWSACFFSVPHTSKVSCNVLKENKPTIAISSCWLLSSSCWLLSSSCWLQSSKQITTDHNTQSFERCSQKPQKWSSSSSTLS